MLINGASIGKESTKNRTVKELNLLFRLTNTAGTGTVGILPLLRNISIKCVLHRTKKQHVILNDNVQNYAIESHFHKGLEGIISAAFLTQKGNGVAVLPITIDLPGPINLQHDDLLELDVNVLNGAYPAGLNVAACNLDINWREETGIEEYIPHITAKYIQAGEGQFNESLGSNIKTILLLNFDQGLGGTAEPLDTAQVVTGLQLTSKNWNINDSYDRLFSRKIRQFETAAASAFRGQCYHLKPHNGELLDNVQMQLTMNSALVTAANNVIIFRHFTMEGETSVRAHELHHSRTKAHTDKLHSHIGGVHMNMARGAFSHGNRNYK